MAWICKICGIAHDDLPDCFGMDAPWPGLVPEDEFEDRVEMNDDACVVDGNTFFIRGHLEIPIHGHRNALTFSVWSSLSEKSFEHMGARWEEPGREADPPYFGWLCSSIWIYPDTFGLKLSVQSRPVGMTPLFEILDEDHPLAVDQRNGISIERWHRMARQLLA